MKGLLVLVRKWPIAGTRIVLQLSAGLPRLRAYTTFQEMDDNLKDCLEFQARSWAVTFEEAEYLLHDYFSILGWAKTDTSRVVHILPRGWDIADEARRGKIQSDIGFIAMAFRDVLRPLLDQGLEPGIRMAGYNAVRVDRTQHNNKIDDEIIALIRRSKFVVADFSVNRGGVYYEAGFAYGLNRQVIWTIREDRLQRVHFDTRQYNFILWKQDTLDQFAKDLAFRIEKTIGRGPLVHD